MFAGHPVSFRALSANLLQLWISSLDSKLPNHQQITSISKLEVLTESSSQLKVGTGNVFRPVKWARFTTSVRTLSLNFGCFWFSKRQKATKSLEQFWFARFSFFVCTVSLLVATARRLLGLPDSVRPFAKLRNATMKAVAYKVPELQMHTITKKSRWTFQSAWLNSRLSGSADFLFVRLCFVSGRFTGVRL